MEYHKEIVLKATALDLINLKLILEKNIKEIDNWIVNIEKKLNEAESKPLASLPFPIEFSKYLPELTPKKNEDEFLNGEVISLKKEIENLNSQLDYFKKYYTDHPDMLSENKTEINFDDRITRFEKNAKKTIKKKNNYDKQ